MAWGWPVRWAVRPKDGQRRAVFVVSSALVPRCCRACVKKGVAEGVWFSRRREAPWQTRVPDRSKKASLSPSALRLAEEDLKRIPSKGWAEMIRKVYEVDPMVCPKCGGRMKVVAFITEYAVADRIIDHLMKLTFAAAKPPPPHVFEQVALMTAEENADYF